MLGPLTNIHIAASSLASAVSYMRPGDVASGIAKAVTNFHDGVQKAYANGALRKNPTMFRELTDAHATTLEKMNSLADGISRLSGRGVTEYVTKGLLQAAGEHVVRTRLPLAKGGDQTSIDLLKRIDPNFDPIKNYTGAEIDKLASNFGSLVHGAHDARTLPSWMLHETALQPFFSLASWSIGQTNNFMQHVITPAYRGDYTPLVMSTLGAGLGGYLIKELREGASNKKSPIPSFQEIANSPRGVSGNLPLVGYNLAAMASFAGYAGILSAGAKSIFDIAHKNVPQGMTFPLDEVVGNVLKTATHAGSALMNTSDPKEYVSIGLHAISDIARENIQLARLAQNWGDETGAFGSDRQYKQKLNTEEGELRRFKMASGLPYDEQSEGGGNNPYLAENRGTLKRDMDLADAAHKLPELFQQAMKESTVDGNLNPDILRNKLKALKGGSYPSMPDPERTPTLFYNYLNYLRKTKGEEAASNRLVEYIKNNQIHKIRSEMVPSV